MKKLLCGCVAIGIAAVVRGYALSGEEVRPKPVDRPLYARESPFVQAAMIKEMAEPLSVEEFNTLQHRRRKIRRAGEIAVVPTIVNSSFKDVTLAFDGDYGSYAVLENGTDAILDLGAEVVLDHIDVKYGGFVDAHCTVFATSRDGLKNVALMSLPECADRTVRYQLPQRKCRYLKLSEKHSVDGSPGGLYELGIYIKPGKKRV